MKLPDYMKTILRVIGILAGLLAGGCFLLPLLLPFVLGYGFSVATEAGVRLLGSRTGLPRWARSGICVTLFYIVVGAALYCFFRVVWAELLNLVRQLPALLRQLQPTLEQLRGWLEDLARKAPQGISRAILRFIDRLFQGGDLLLQSGYSFLSRLVTRMVAGVPDLVLTLITTLIATYMISAALPDIKQWLRTHLPLRWQKWLRQTRSRIRTALGGWCKAQLKMMLIVFLLLTTGLWLLRVEYALLFGGIIAILDALPVLGTGTVLIPWAVISFLQNNSSMGFGLLTLYAVTALARTALEPRLVGQHLGLHPLLTLMAFYTGYRLFGIIGMILFPLLSMICKQLLAVRGAE